jgi:hypothetical protein
MLVEMFLLLKDYVLILRSLSGAITGRLTPSDYDLFGSVIISTCDLLAPFKEVAMKYHHYTFISSRHQ